MEKLPANTGWIWVKEGFALFRKQPAELSTLFISYMFLMLAIGIIPVVGQILPLILVPVFSMAFMQACVQIELGKRIYPSLLLTGFRSPAFPRLLKLGGLYLLAIMLVLAASSLVDGGVFWNVMSGQLTLDAKVVQDSNMSVAMLFSSALYVPVSMAFWYAAPLAMWQEMGVVKAVFYSFFAVRNAGKAFMVYGLCWAAIGVLMPALVSVLIAALLNQSMAVMLILMPLSVVLTVIMYCSFYSTYVYVFGKPVASEVVPST